MAGGFWMEGGAVVVGQNYNKSRTQGYWERTILEIDCMLLGSTFFFLWSPFMYSYDVINNGAI